MLERSNPRAISRNRFANYYRHRLLPLDQRRGVQVQEDVQPLVLGIIRGVVLSLGLTFKSEVLHKALKKMSPISSLRVEGPVSSDLIKQYTVPHTEAGGRKAHRSHTSAHLLKTSCNFNTLVKH